MPGGALYLELQEQKKRLVAETAGLREIGSTVDSALRNRVQKARHWLKEVIAAPLVEPVATAAMESAIKKLEACTTEQTEVSLAAVASEAEQLKAALSRAGRPSVQQRETNYPAALKIYQTLKTDSPQESLVNPVKALRLERPVKPGSLAEKLHTEHPVARAIVS